MSQRLNLLQAILEKSPGDTFAMFAIAKEFEGLGDWPAALDFYLKLKTADPHYVGLYYHLGKLYQRLDQTETAAETYRAGMQVAQQLNDRHAYSELYAALQEISPDDDDEV